MTQPEPEMNTSTPIHALVMADLAERLQKGIRTYGTPLQAGNGRNHLWDAYEEVLDLACYLRAEIEETEKDGL